MKDLHFFDSLEIELNKGYPEEGNAAFIRLKKCISDMGVSIKPFARKVEKVDSGGPLLNMLIRRTKFRAGKLMAMADRYPQINLEYVLTGEGDPLLPIDGVQPTITNHRKAVRFFPYLNATAGNSDAMPDEQTEYELFSIKGYEGCDAFPATGDSMLPTIKAGDIVIHKEWTEKYIQGGYIYIIVTNSGQRAIKRLSVARTEERDGFPVPIFLCSSDNHELYTPYEIDGEDIVYLGLVQGIIRSLI